MSLDFATPTSKISAKTEQSVSLREDNELPQR
jgi:hypothetical protein